MGFSCEMDEPVKLIGLEEIAYKCPVKNISFDKGIGGFLGDISQILQVTGIGQGIQVHNLVSWETY